MELFEWIVILSLCAFTAIIYWSRFWLTKRNNSRIFSCPNPDCARCRIMREFEQTRRALKNKLSELLRDRPETGAWLCRIQPMLNKPNNEQVWYLEGLVTPPWINHDTPIPELSNLHQTLSKLFLSNDVLQLLLCDYQWAARDAGKWKINTIPSGKWRVYHLMDQGVWQKDRNHRMASCPNIMQLLGSITPHLMTCNLYGNVLLSELEWGSSIEPHTGPCNFRIRCHIPIQPSSGFHIRVGTEVRTWEQGKLLLFTDHHEHEVWHNIRTTKTENLSRVVLIFDIWHPIIKNEEKNILNQLFNESAT